VELAHVAKIDLRDLPRRRLGIVAPGFCYEAGDVPLQKQIDRWIPARYSAACLELEPRL
jgi:hypothetical protein